MKNKHLGGDFDEFLQEEGLLADAEAAAVKRVIAYQLKEYMEKTKLSKTTLAKKMHTSRSAVDRLLDPANISITLQTIERAAMVMGKRVNVEFVKEG